MNAWNVIDDLCSVKIGYAELAEQEARHRSEEQDRGFDWVVFFRSEVVQQLLDHRDRCPGVTRSQAGYQALNELENASSGVSRSR